MPSYSFSIRSCSRWLNSLYTATSSSACSGLKDTICSRKGRPTPTMDSSRDTSRPNTSRMACWNEITINSTESTMVPSRSKMTALYARESSGFGSGL